MKATVGSLTEKRKCVSSCCGTTSGAVDTHFSGLPSSPGKVFEIAAWISGSGPKSTGGGGAGRLPIAGGTTACGAGAGAVCAGRGLERAARPVSASAASGRIFRKLGMVLELRLNRVGGAGDYSIVFHLNSAPLLRAGLAPSAVAVTGPGVFGIVARYRWFVSAISMVSPRRRFTHWNDSAMPGFAEPRLFRTV